MKPAHDGYTTRTNPFDIADEYIRKKILSNFTCILQRILIR